MSNNKNTKKTIWVYAVILFTSAFIVLLITAYSQIKFNNNINEYKNRITDEESAKKNYILSYNNAAEENKKLKEELDKVNKEMASTKNKLETMSTEIADLEANNASITKTYNALILGLQEYNNGDYISCALLLKEGTSPDIINGEAKNLYDTLSEKTYYKAAESLYYQGYELYTQGSYDKAIERFNQSLSIFNNQYFSDDSYYFLSLSEYKTGSIDNALAHFKYLLDNYKDSTYKLDTEYLINEIQKAK